MASSKTIFCVRTPTTDIRERPVDDAVIDRRSSQILYGESFIVEDEPNNEFYYGHAAHDLYPGYVKKNDLRPCTKDKTHYINRRFSHLYAKPDFKTRPVCTVSFLSRLSVTEKEKNGFIQTDQGLWVFNEQIAQLANLRDSFTFLDTALLYIGTPYLYGGRSAFGIDCTGLVQNALLHIGYPNPPRDSDKQIIVGEPVKGSPQRGNLVFFEGHVGIMIDTNTILNATARNMDTRIEPLQNLIKYYGDITHIRRI